MKYLSAGILFCFLVFYLDTCASGIAYLDIRQIMSIRRLQEAGPEAGLGATLIAPLVNLSLILTAKYVTLALMVIGLTTFGIWKSRLGWYLCIISTTIILAYSLCLLLIPPLQVKLDIFPWIVNRWLARLYIGSILAWSIGMLVALRWFHRQLLEREGGGIGRMAVIVSITLILTTVIGASLFLANHYVTNHYVDRIDVNSLIKRKKTVTLRLVIRFFPEKVCGHVDSSFPEALKPLFTAVRERDLPSLKILLPFYLKRFRLHPCKDGIFLSTLGVLDRNDDHVMFEYINSFRSINKREGEIRPR